MHSYRFIFTKIIPICPEEWWEIISTTAFPLFSSANGQIVIIFIIINNIILLNKKKKLQFLEFKLK